MPLADRPLNVAILAVPEVTASTLFGMLDLFASAGRDWSFLLSGVAGEQRMCPYVVAAEPVGFTAANGVWVRPDWGLADAPAPDIVCVPDFFVVPGEPLGDRLNNEVAWLRACHAGGATIASASNCSVVSFMGALSFMAFHPGRCQPIGTARAAGSCSNSDQ